MRRSRQSDLVAAQGATAFVPAAHWLRVSFLDLIGDGPQHRVDDLEPAYIDGATVIAVWPSAGELETVRVVTWAPSSRDLIRLHQLQAEWPAALCDVRVRLTGSGVVELEPCRSGLARNAARLDNDAAYRVQQALERGVRALGRTLTVAA